MKDEASFKEAEEVMAELISLHEPIEEDEPKDKGKKGKEEEKKLNTEEVELPAFPIVIVSTHNDLKKNAPGSRVADEVGSDLANGFGLPFFKCNAKGENVHEAFSAAISSIENCEANMTFETAPGVLSRCKVQCCTGCPELCCYPQPCVDKACPEGEQPKHPCRKENWDKNCCWKNAK